MNRESVIPELPSELLEAIAPPSRGRVVLVLGAGCSLESPTGLPLSGDLAAECHRRLVADTILSHDEVDDNRNLSSLAEAVFRKTGSQRALIDRLEPDRFRNAEPNEGYLIMGALLLEEAVANTVTLNFDRAASAALTQLGARAEVSTIRNPEDHGLFGTGALIYLHRDIDSPPDDLILRTGQLEEAWREHWEEVVVQRVLAGPVTVFVGLGNPASALVETTKRIHAALDGNSQARAYVVDPTPREDSQFAAALEIAPEAYFCMGWGEFMGTLAQRVLIEHRAHIERECDALINELGIEAEDVADLCDRLVALGLVGLGRLRAAWMLHGSSYLSQRRTMPLRPLGALVLGIAMLERVSGRQARFSADGLVEFADGPYITRVVVCSGGGWMNRAAVEAKLSERLEAIRGRGDTPSAVLVAGMEDSPDIATPSNIAADTDPDDLVTGPSHLPIVKLTNLRADHGLIHEVIG